MTIYFLQSNSPQSESGNGKLYSSRKIYYALERTPLFSTIESKIF